MAELPFDRAPGEESSAKLEGVLNGFVASLCSIEGVFDPCSRIVDGGVCFSGVVEAVFAPIESSDPEDLLSSHSSRIRFLAASARVQPSPASRSPSGSSVSAGADIEAEEEEEEEADVEEESVRRMDTSLLLNQLLINLGLSATSPSPSSPCPPSSTLPSNDCDSASLI